MQTIYQFDLASGAATGHTQEIAAHAGVPLGWTRLAPPQVDGEHFAVWAGGRWVVLDAVPDADLGPMKAAKNAAINAARLAANFSTFEHAGEVIACDQLSRSDIDGTNGYVALHGTLPVGWPGGWKTADNSYVAIGDVAAWKEFYGSMFAAGNANFAHAQALKALLAAATTASEVAAIQWTMEL